MPNFSCLAPAKINLCLHVTGQLANGYHQLESLVTFTQFGDHLILSVDESRSFETFELEITGVFSGQLKADECNLVIKAANAFFLHFNFKPDRQISFTLEKNLPIASGIGGGSANAAAALLLLAYYFERQNLSELHKIAAGLGADVPMCLYSLPLFARGIGEDVETLTDFPALHLVLVNPGISVSTPQIFQALEKKNNPPMAEFPVTCDNLLVWLNNQRNDLVEPAKMLVPEIKKAEQALKMQKGCLFAQMSGSGATCFGVFGTQDEAQRAAQAIASQNGNWWVQTTRTVEPASDPFKRIKKEDYDRN